MFPLLPFAAGLLAGVAATRLIRGKKAKKQLSKTQDRLREAGVSTLNTIEQSMARLHEMARQRDRIQETTLATAFADSTDSDAVAPETKVKAKLEKSPRKTSTKPKAPASSRDDI
jgi:hypothetical protein